MEKRLPTAIEHYVNTEVNERKCLRAIHSVIHRDMLLGTSKVIFDTLFPEKENVDLYNKDKDTRETHPTSRFLPEEKKLAEIVYSELGLTSIKPEKREKGEPTSPHDEPDFRIAYTPSKSSFMSWINELPILNDMSGVAQVDAMPGEGTEKEYKKMDRKKHSKILGAAVTRDIVRMAIKTPNLFQERVARDMKYFRKIDTDIPQDVLIGKQNIPLIIKKIEAFNLKGERELEQMAAEGVPITAVEIAKRQLRMPDKKKLEALASGMEYTKYITLFAYLHDSQTPALADVIMKAKGRFPGQRDIKFSEDEVLGMNIEGIVSKSSIEGVKHMFNHFHLSKKFFIAQVHSMCEENDPTLGGMLIKNKRKRGYVEKGGPEDLAGLPAFDRDQVAGTIANMEDRANRHLPGGFVHSYKTDEVTKIPIGSFTERLQLLAYAMARNMTKGELAIELRGSLAKEGFRSKSVQDDILQNIAITAEEFEYGPNFILRRLPSGEIAPVALDPGALKRLLLSFSTLTYFHYQGDRRSAYETFIQDIITTLHAYQKKFVFTSPYNSPEMSHILNTFVERSDRGALAMLQHDYPVIARIIETYLNKGTRVTEKELPALLDSIHDEGEFAFVSRAQFIPVDQKEGTLVEDELDEEKTPTPYLNVIRYKKEGKRRIDNPLSLPNRLDAIAQQLQNEKLYFVIRVSQADIRKLKAELQKTNPLYKNLVTRAFRYWTMDVLIQNQEGGNQIVINPLRTQFALPQENLGVVYDEHLGEVIVDVDGFGVSISENLLFLNEAQGIELHLSNKGNN